MKTLINARISSIPKLSSNGISVSFKLKQAYFEVLSFVLETNVARLGALLKVTWSQASENNRENNNSVNGVSLFSFVHFQCEVMSSAGEIEASEEND